MVLRPNAGNRPFCFMEASHLNIVARYLLSISAATVLLTGCGESQPLIGAPGSMRQMLAISTHAGRSGSWMLPEAKSQDLLYVSDANRGMVFAFSYPALRSLGTLTGFGSPSGECVDGSGNGWITNLYPPEVIKYSHGGTTPIQTIDDSGQPFSCAVDPITGDLAVTNDYGVKGSVTVYPRGSGPPKVYTDPDIKHDLYVTYDGSGNLFVDGNSGKPLIAKLSKGRDKLVTITLNRKKMLPVSMQWDGTYLAIIGAYGVTHRPTVVDRVKISGRTGTIVTTSFLKSHGYKDGDPVQYWIYGNAIVGPGAVASVS
jgi:hypothetical protein